MRAGQCNVIGIKSQTVKQCIASRVSRIERDAFFTDERRRGAQTDSLTRRGDTRRRETKSRRDKRPRAAREVLMFLYAIHSREIKS